MVFSDQTYSVLVVSAAQKFNEAFAAMLDLEVHGSLGLARDSSADPASLLPNYAARLGICFSFPWRPF